MAQTGVFRPVVVDGESFLDALFVLERQDPDTRQHPPQVESTNRHHKSMRRTGLIWWVPIGEIVSEDVPRSMLPS